MSRFSALGRFFGKGAKTAEKVEDVASGAVTLKKVGMFERGLVAAGRNKGNILGIAATTGGVYTIGDLVSNITGVLDAGGERARDAVKSGSLDYIPYLFIGLFVILGFAVAWYFLGATKRNKEKGVWNDPDSIQGSGADKFGGGGKKLMNVNILLVIFIGYLLFYLYERYFEMINKEKELNKFRKN